MPDPTHAASGMHLRFQVWIRPHTAAHKALNPRVIMISQAIRMFLKWHFFFYLKI